MQVSPRSVKMEDVDVRFTKSPKPFMYYVNYALKIILIILTIYCFIVGYQFFTWFSNSSVSHDVVMESCNLDALSENDQGFCCEQKNVYVSGEIIGSTCYGLRSAGIVDGIHEYECGGVVCR